VLTPEQGKNTTVMVDGFAINKGSMTCADWEAVPTLAGKDPRLAERKREKKAAINNQEHCTVCWDGGELFCCSGCPRSYHMKCLDKTVQLKAKSKMQFYCPQHECVDCQGKTGDVGGMVYRCRWCAHGYCEDCLDWNTVKLVGETLLEYEMLGYGAMSNAWYIECPGCIARWADDEVDRIAVENEKETIRGHFDKWVEKKEREAGAAAAVDAMGVEGLSQQGKASAKVVDLSGAGYDSGDADDITPATMSEAWTPLDTDMEHVSDGRGKKMTKMF
jgi:SWI/SNF-related matrix-associated actin-dependent regulator of chromatin subfamily A member 5